MPDWLTLDHLEKCAKILAVIIGGVWVVWDINWRRERAPKAQMEHAFYSRDLRNGQRLVTIILTIRNCGSVLLEASTCFTRLQQVYPLPFGPELNAHVATGKGPLGKDGTHFTWLLLGKREFGGLEIEPGESDSVQCDFLVADAVETVTAYSYIPNQWKPKLNIGWTHTTIHDIPRGGRQLSMPDVIVGNATERQQHPARDPEPVDPDKIIQREPEPEPQPVKKARASTMGGER